MTDGVEEADVSPAYTIVALLAPAAVYREADCIADTAAGKVQGQSWLDVFCSKDRSSAQSCRFFERERRA